MNVQTYLAGDLLEMFQEKMKTENKTKYALAREILTEYFSEDKQTNEVVKIEDPRDFQQTGDFEVDIISLDKSGITDKMLKSALAELDHQKKTKNTLKKCGAFHEENAILDIKSMFHGKPNFYELKYTFDWWYLAGMITNVLSRRGIKMSKRYSEIKDGINVRYDAGQEKSSYDTYLKKYRIGAKKK